MPAGRLPRRTSTCMLLVRSVALARQRRPTKLGAVASAHRVVEHHRHSVARGGNHLLPHHRRHHVHRRLQPALALKLVIHLLRRRVKLPMPRLRPTCACCCSSGARRRWPPGNRQWTRHKRHWQIFRMSPPCQSCQPCGRSPPIPYPRSPRVPHILLLLLRVALLHNGRPGGVAALAARLLPPEPLLAHVAGGKHGLRCVNEEDELLAAGLAVLQRDRGTWQYEARQCGWWCHQGTGRIPGGLLRPELIAMQAVQGAAHDHRLAAAGLAAPCLRLPTLMQGLVVWAELTSHTGEGTNATLKKCKRNSNAPTTPEWRTSSSTSSSA